MATIPTTPVGSWWPSILSLLSLIVYAVLIGLAIAALIKYLRTP